MTSEQALERLRIAVESARATYDGAEQEYCRSGFADIDRVGLLAYRLGALESLLRHSERVFAEVDRRDGGAS